MNNCAICGKKCRRPTCSRPCYIEMLLKQTEAELEYTINDYGNNQESTEVWDRGFAYF